MWDQLAVGASLVRRWVARKILRGRASAPEYGTRLALPRDPDLDAHRAWDAQMRARLGLLDAEATLLQKENRP